MIKTIKNTAARFKAFIKLMAVFLFISISVISFPNKSSLAAVTIMPLPEAGICTPMTCAAPGTYTFTVTNLGTAIGTAIVAAQTMITSKLTSETTLSETGLNTTILNDHIKGFMNYFADFWLTKLDVYLKQIAANMSQLEANQERMVASLMDADAQNKTVRSLQTTEEEAKRALDPSESLQKVTTVIGGLQRAKTIQLGYGFVSSKVHMERSAAKSEVGDLAGSGEEEDLSKGAYSDIAKRWDKYVTQYCKTGSNAGHSGCTEDGTYADMDINIADTIFSRETIDYADEGIAQAVNDLVVNIAEPFIIDPLPAGLSDGTKGQEVILEREEYKSRRQAIYDALNHIVSRRVPGSQMGEYLFELREEAGISVDNLSSGSSNPSYNEVMHYLTTERTRTGVFSIEGLDEPENNARERVVQSALFLMQLNDMADLLDRQSVLLAAQVSANIKETIGDLGAAVEQKATNDEE